MVASSGASSYSWWYATRQQVLIASAD